MNGLTKYIPSNNQLKKVKPNIYFEEIEVAYIPLDTININTYSKTLKLRPRENHLSFQYKSTDINHPRGIEYRWRLNGEFSPWSSKDYIDFANLDSGNYLFIVQSRNIDWIESELIKFSFFIEKPLLEKLWFIIAVSCTLISIVVFYILLSFKRIKQKNKDKISQLAIENHMLSLEQKTLQLQMNPHFIFNVLNGIKALGSLGKIQQMNETIHTFASLLRSILNSSKLEEVSLAKEIKTLRNYMNLEQQMSSNLFEYTIDIKTKNIDPEELLIPPMLLQPFIENSIKHGFYQLNKKGKITISFSVEEEFLQCKIKDNGIGITKSKEQKKQHHASMAIQVTKERIESLSGKNTLHITEENGTLISFVIPLKTDY
jgi:two-component system sensor histidine kinase LytS